VNLRRNIITLFTLFFCLGIFLADKLKISDYTIITVFILLIVGSLLSIKFLSRFKQFTITCFSFLILVLLGFFNHSNYNSLINNSKKYLNTDNFYKGEIKSVSYTNSGKLKFDIKVDKIKKGNKFIPVDFKVLSYVNVSKLDAKVGDLIYFKARIKQFEFYNNPWDFDYGKYNLRKGIIGYIFIDKHNSKVISLYKNNFSSYEIRKKLNHQLENYLNGQELEVCKAFLWGDRDGVSDYVMGAFSNTGTIHILAVSGLHVGILFSIILFLLRIFSAWIDKRTATIITIIVVWMYAYLTGFSPSILRSVIVFSLIFYSDLLEKRRNELMLMSLSALILLIIDTNYLFDLGFQLTYAALTGIYLFFPYFEGIYNVKNRFLNYFYLPLMLGFSAQLTCLPIILYNFHQFPNYFTFANLFLVPFSFLIILLGIAFYVLSFSLICKYFIGFLLSFIIKSMISIVCFFDSLPFSVSKQFDFKQFDFVVYVILILLFYFVLQSKNRRLLYITCSFSIVFVIYIQLKRFNSLNQSYVARVGNSSDLIVKTNKDIYYIKNDFKLVNLERVQKNYQNKVKLLKMNSQSKLDINGKVFKSESSYKKKFLKIKN